MKGWKRMASVVLVASLCLTMLQGIPGYGVAEAAQPGVNGQVLTEEAGINLVNNAGFEYDNGADVEAWGKNLVEINSDEAFVHSGAKSLKVAAGQTDTAYAFSGLNATYNLNAAVKAGMWVYLSDASDAEKILIVLERKEGNNIMLRPQAQTGWQKVVVEGAAIANCMEHVIKFEVAAGNAGDVYFDDAFVFSDDAEAINILRNGGFENNLDAWGGAPAVVNNETHGGNSAISIIGAKDVFQASGWWPNKQSVDAGIPLYYSAWIKSQDATGTLKLRAEVQYYASTVNYESQETVTGTTDWRWLFVEIPHKADLGPVKEILFHIETTDGTGAFYADDVKASAIKPQTEEPKPPITSGINGQVLTGEAGINLVNNAGFEYDNGTDVEAWGKNLVEINSDGAFVHSGAKSLKVAANQTAVAYAFSGLNADYNLNAAVKAGMWVYLSNAADAEKTLIVLERKEGNNIMVRPQAQTGWQKVVVEGAAIANCMEHVIKFEVAEGNAGDVYFDDAFVFSDDAEAINILRNGGFENNLDAWGGAPAVVNDEIHGGNAAISITGAKDVFQASGWWPNKQSVDARIPLYYSVWIKSQDATGTLKLRAEVKDFTDAAVANYASTETVTGTTDWTQLSVEIPYKADQGPVKEILFHIETTDGTGTFYADDAKVFGNVGTGEPEQPEEPSLGEPPSTEDRTPGTVVTGESGENALLNPGFELGDESWGFVNVSVQNDTSKTHSGAISAVSDGNVNGAVWNVLPGSFYASGGTRVTGYVWLNDAQDAARVHPRFKQEKDGELLVEYAPDTPLKAQAGWQKFVITVPERTEQDATTAVVVVDIDAGAKSVYLDDFHVEKAIEPEQPQVGEPSTEDRTPGVVVTGEKGENALPNPGFETGEESWGLINAIVQEDPAKTHSGAKSVITQGSGGGAVFTGLPANLSFSKENIKVTGYIWLNNPEDAARVHPKFRYENNGQSLAEYTVALEAKTGWQRFVIDVPARPELEVTYTVLVVDFDAGARSVYMDDFYVQKAATQAEMSSNYVTNGDFELVNAEKNEAAHWGLMPGWDKVPGSVSTAKVNGGCYAIAIGQAEEVRHLTQSSLWRDMAVTPEYDPSKPMLLTAYVYYENLTDAGAFLEIETKRGGNSSVVMGEALTGSSNGWEKVELYLPPSTLAAPVDEILAGIKVTAGSGIIYVDDVTFEQTELRSDKAVDKYLLKHQEVEQRGFKWIGNPGFELDLNEWGVIPEANARITKETVHSGSKALQITGEMHLWNVLGRNIDRSVEMALSFWAYFENPEDAELLQFYASRKNAREVEIERYKFYAEKKTGWQKVSVVIPACDVTPDIMVIGADTIANMTGNVYLDDFYLTYTENNPEEEKPNLVANGSFEYGTEKPDGWGAIPEYGQGTKWGATAKDGDKATQLTAKADTSVSVFQSTAWGVTPDFDYGAPLRLTAYVKTSSLDNGCFLRIERKNNDKLVGDAVVSEVIQGTNDWTQIELYIPPVEGRIEEFIVVAEVMAGKGFAIVDDIRLNYTKERKVDPQEEDSLLKNPGLEKLNPDGSILHWDVWPGTPEEGQRKYESVTNEVHGGERAVKIELVYGNGQAIYQYRVMDDNPFDFNQSYEASVWVKTENVSVYDGKGVKLGVKRRDTEGNEHNLYTDIPLGTSDGWIQVKLPAEKADADIIQYDVIVDIGSGSGVIYLDDFDLVPLDTETEPALSNVMAVTKVDKDFYEGTDEEQDVLNAPVKAGKLFWPVAGGLSAAGTIGAAAIVLVDQKKKKMLLKRLK